MRVHRVPLVREDKPTSPMCSRAAPVVKPKGESVKEKLIQTTETEKWVSWKPKAMPNIKAPRIDDLVEKES